jgi:hypothetical protein
MSNWRELGGFTRDDHTSADAQENEIRDLLHSRPPSLKSGLGKKLVYILGGVIGIAILLGMFSGSNSSLEVERTDANWRNDSMGLIVTNIGHKPIIITGITVNDRDDCKVYNVNAPHSKEDVNLPDPNRNFPETLKVGDKGKFYSRCVAIRTKIMTSDGTYDFSFDR